MVLLKITCIYVKIYVVFTLKAEMHMKIEDCGLSVRATNCCKAAGLETVGDIVKLHPSDLLKFRNFGMKSIVELKEKIESLGIKWN